MGDCEGLIKFSLQKNHEDFNYEIPSEVNELPKLTRIQVNAGIQIIGKLSEDANAVKEIWIGLGGLEETWTKGEDVDIYKWENVTIENGRVTELGERLSVVKPRGLLQLSSTFYLPLY